MPDIRRLRFIFSVAVGLILLVGTPRRGVRISRRAIPSLKTARVLFAAIALLTGCRPTQSAESAPPASLPDSHPVSPASPPTAARIHWRGIKQLSGQPDAAAFMAIWNLPESGRLERQTLDKLSLAAWRLLHRRLDAQAAARLRPLLDDLVADESYFEIRPATNSPGELVLAVRLDDRRAALWQTNLAAVLESLTGIPPIPAPGRRYGWSLKKHHDPNLLELTRAGGWTIVGAAENHNGLLDEMQDRIRQGQTPFPAGNTNDWLTADFNPAQLISCLATFNFEHSTLNHFHLAVTGDDTNVLWQGTADFSRPLALDLKPWNIPTNLMDQQLVSLTMVRGLQPWLESLDAWNQLQIGPPPDQAFFWALASLPMENYFAAPLPGASNAVDRLTEFVLQKQKVWFATNDEAGFERSKTFNGLEWRGVPLVSPFLRSITVGDQNYLYGGGFPNVSAEPLSLKSVQTVLSRPHLVYHDWEQTRYRTRHWIDLGQIVRFLLHKATLPPDSPGYLWLKTIALKPGESVTDITQTGPNQLSLTRKSTVGFTGIELNLLADWLESPDFPRGLHTLLAPPPAQP